MYSPQRIEEEVSAPAASAPHVIADHPEWTLGRYGRAQPGHAEALLTDALTSRHLRIATMEGESGTGKALAAQTLHDLGPVSAAPLIPCPAVQFFQHGPSLVPLMPVMRDARGGTLFLTHVEELSLEQQARLLALLQWLDHQHARHTVDSIPRQVFFSSNQPLRKLSASPAFRADLCHRLTAIRFAIPPLRDRRDDLALLADYFAQRFSATHGKPVRGLAPLTLPRLNSHPWPGNVRELQSVIHSAALDCEGQWIRPIDIPAAIASSRCPRHSSPCPPRTTPTSTAPSCATSIWCSPAWTATSFAPPNARHQPLHPLSTAQPASAPGSSDSTHRIRVLRAHSQGYPLRFAIIYTALSGSSP